MTAEINRGCRVVWQRGHRLEGATGETVGRLVVRKSGIGAARGFPDAVLLQLTIRRHKMSLGTVLLIILVLLLIGAIPTWPHSRGWGYYPSGGVGLLLLILIILWLMGKI